MKQFIEVNIVDVVDDAIKSVGPALIDGSSVKRVQQTPTKPQPSVKVLFDDGTELHCLGDLKHFAEGMSIAGLL